MGDEEKESLIVHGMLKVDLKYILRKVANYNGNIRVQCYCVKFDYFIHIHVVILLNLRIILIKLRG